MSGDNATAHKLLKDMKRTGGRFSASKRIKEHERRTTRNTAYSSVAVVVITIVPVFFPMARLLENSNALLTVAPSIFILASSLLQSSNSGQVRADQFQMCALEVNCLRRIRRSFGRRSWRAMYSFSPPDGRFPGTLQCPEIIKRSVGQIQVPKWPVLGLFGQYWLWFLIKYPDSPQRQTGPE